MIKNKKVKINLIIIALLFLANVLVSVGNGNFGSNLVDVEKKSLTLTEENKKIKQQIIASDSLTKIEQQELQNGFQKPDNIVYIKTIPTVAQASTK
ncbi:MAG: hypothetical protein HY044_03195 [Candidatus Woesebacteria bacterium]|nr:MAG: hypothetical protein HY044_03195 [Candidatus Woesebacteria bacterium]